MDSPRIIALMAFYDEYPSWLAATVASCARFCDHIVALDGAYALYPGGKASSGIEQSEAIRTAAEAVGMGCTIHVPQTVWLGNETEKRTRLFQIGSAIAEEGDWFFVIDADELVVEHTEFIKHDLAATDLLVADVGFRERQEYPETIPVEIRQTLPMVAQSRVRRLFRVIDNMRVGLRHYDYLGEFEGETVSLWGDSKLDSFDGTHVVIEHRNKARLHERREAAKRYYEIRDSVGAEKKRILMEGIHGDLTEVPN